MARSVKKNASTQASAKQQGAGLSSEGENIDKIRDILFGAQTRQIDKKLATLEVKIENDIQSLRSETKTSLDTLEQFIRKEFQNLSDQVNGEKTTREESVENLSDKLSNTKKSFEKKIGQASDKALKDQRETQDQILKQSKTLMEEILQRNDALQNRIDQAVEALNHEKTDRQALANLLMEVGMRLKDEFQLPDVE